MVCSGSCKTPLPTSESAPGSVSVLTFGAVGDGVANDTKAFERAFAALKKGDIGELYLPKGEYSIDSLRVEGLYGAQIRGAGMYNTRLLPRVPVKTFIQFGKHDVNERLRLAKSVNGIKMSHFRIFDAKGKAMVGLRLENCQDNILEQVEVRGIEVAIEIKQSWLNTLRNVKVVDFGRIGIDLQEKSMNANLFETVRASSKGKGGVCYKVAGNSATFINCTAEGGATGWDFGYCRMVNLIGCHSEHGTPFALSAKSGSINISGHFIWKPESLWSSASIGRAESVAMRNCYIYSLSGKVGMNIPGKTVVNEGNLQSKVY